MEPNLLSVFRDCVRTTIKYARPIDEFLSSPLYQTVKKLLAEKTDRERIVAAFEQLREEYRKVDDEISEDAVMGVIACLGGWCGPHARL